MTTIVINYHVNVNKVSEIRVVFTSNVIYRVYVFRNGSPPLFPGANVSSLVPGSSRPTPKGINAAIRSRMRQNKHGGAIR